MKQIRNNIIPFPGFRAINLFGLLFVRKGARIDPVLLNHESIHTRQMVEMLFVFFYLWYGVEWSIHLIRFKDAHLAYRRISFEREAYAHQADMRYLNKRKLFSFFDYIG